MVTMTLDPMAYLQRLMTDLAFAAQVRGDARRTIICHPDEAPGMRAAVDQLRAEDVITVKASPFPPKGTAYVIDDAALEASQAQAMQRFIKTPMGRWGRP
jgi:predicted amidohydrolase